MNDQIRWPQPTGKPNRHLSLQIFNNLLNFRGFFAGSVFVTQKYNVGMNDD